MSGRLGLELNLLRCEVSAVFQPHGTVLKYILESDHPTPAGAISAPNVSKIMPPSLPLS